MMQRLVGDGVPFKLDDEPDAAALRDAAGRTAANALPAASRAPDRSRAARDRAQSRQRANCEKLAHFYCDWFIETRRRYVEEWNRDLVGAFRQLRDAGVLEIIGCAATHGLLPLAGAIARSRARAGADRSRRLSRHIRRRARWFLAAGVRLRAGPREAPAGSKHALVHARCARARCSGNRDRAARSTRPVSRPRVRLRSRAIRNRAARSGARSRVIRATRRIAISTATSASIFPPNYVWPRRQDAAVYRHQVSSHHRTRRREGALQPPLGRERRARARRAFPRVAAAPVA